MPGYEVSVFGRGLWISLDDDVLRVDFRVSRFVDATDAWEAGELALLRVAEDPKAQPVPGRPPPVIEVDHVEPTSDDPRPQPGFEFIFEFD